MELIKTKGLVLRSVSTGDFDKMLTVLTAEYGKITVLAKGAKGIRHGKSACANVFCYSDFVLYPKKELYLISQCSGIESFFDLSGGLDRLNCAANLVEFADYICQEEQEAGEVLRIVLNSLYALAALHKEPLMVSVVYYLKILSVLGFEPELSGCAACGEEEGLAWFSCACGGLVCAACAPDVPDKRKLTANGLQLMRFVSCCDVKHLFKFQAGNDVLGQVYDILCAFLMEHLDYKPKHDIIEKEM